MVKALKEERYTTYSSAMSILALESYSTQVAAQSANADALGIVQVGKAGGEPQRISELQGCSCRAVQRRCYHRALHQRRQCAGLVW